MVTKKENEIENNLQDGKDPVENKETTKVEVKVENQEAINQEAELKKEDSKVVEDFSNELEEKIDKDSTGKLKEKTKIELKSPKIESDLLPENFNPYKKKVSKFSQSKLNSTFTENVIDIKRVIKVTKGGRQFSFSTLVVVGDKKGRVGFATSKSKEIPDAIKKAVKLAKKNLYKVNIIGKEDTVSHEAIGKHCSARVLLKPAKEGKGIISSNIIRSVVELAGYRNIYSKNLGTNNPQNVINATIKALISMKTKEDYMRLRDIKEDGTK